MLRATPPMRPETAAGAHAEVEEPSEVARARTWSPIHPASWKTRCSRSYLHFLTFEPPAVDGREHQKQGQDDHAVGSRSRVVADPLEGQPIGVGHKNLTVGPRSEERRVGKQRRRRG